MPKGNTAGDPVYSAVIRREKLLADCEIVERAARMTKGGEYAEALILNCCYGVGYDSLDKTILPSSHRAAYWEARRIFYWNLSNLREEAT